jgi:hypothetical protein
MKLLRLLLLVATLLACLGLSAPSSYDDEEEEEEEDDEGVEEDLLMLNVHSTNATTRIQELILAGSLRFLSVLLQSEPQYLGLGPGQEIPYDSDRRLSAAEDGGISRLRPRNRGTTEASAAGSPLSDGSQPPEPSRSLLLLRTCPLTCAKSSSTSCKQVGCAYCGTTCRRRRARGRKLVLTSEKAARIEGAINLLLSLLCGRRKGCHIYSKIVRVGYENGTVVAYPLV